MSLTPALSWLNTANTTTMENNTVLGSKETTNSISDMGAVNESSEMANTKVKQLQSYADEEVSLPLGPSWSITTNPNELFEILTNIEDFIPKVQKEPHPRLLPDINVSPGPANEGEFMQSSSHANQVSASPEDPTNSSEVNNSSQQEQPYGRTEVTRRSIFIGNVDYSVNVMDLLRVFFVCGPINRVTILNDFVISHPRGYAFLEFNDVSSVSWSLTLNNIKINGRKITVQPKNTNEYGIRSNRRQDVVLSQLKRTSMMMLLAVYTSIMFPMQQMSIIYYAPVQQNVPIPTMSFPVQQNVPMPMMPFPVQQNVPMPMMPFPVQQNVPRPMMPFPVSNIYYRMGFY